MSKWKAYDVVGMQRVKRVVYAASREEAARIAKSQFPAKEGHRLLSVSSSLSDDPTPPKEAA